MVGEVVRKMETDFTLVECFSDTSRCILTANCQLKGVFARALKPSSRRSTGWRCPKCSVRRSGSCCVLQRVA